MYIYIHIEKKHHDQGMITEKNIFLKNIENAQDDICFVVESESGNNIKNDDNDKCPSYFAFNVEENEQLVT